MKIYFYLLLKFCYSARHYWKMNEKEECFTRNVRKTQEKFNKQYKILSQFAQFREKLYMHQSHLKF